MLLFVRDFTAWAEAVPDAIRNDTLWRMQAYRLGLFLGDAADGDQAALRRKAGMRSLADQLFRSTTAISATIAEGYGRLGGRDRAHFYEFAFSSARESRDWYYKARRALGAEVVQDRMDVLTQIIRLLYVTIPSERSRDLNREPDRPGGSRRQ
jgi:four helix bundle protein